MSSCLSRRGGIIIGKALDKDILKIAKKSKLYDKGFEHGYRKAAAEK